MGQQNRRYRELKCRNVSVFTSLFPFSNQSSFIHPRIVQCQHQVCKILQLEIPMDRKSIMKDIHFEQYFHYFVALYLPREPKDTC